ncbi:MAG: helix-turn-helix domain-containing protein [Synechococcus sp. BS307-5m-G36]|nr:helix-turn-helix domain-containing protein [Synechococcus sp. BS307-5m-G36]MBL6880340.1 helix-turn-helix domain-containing protein [Synechococcus sp. BS30m-G31]
MDVSTPTNNQESNSGLLFVGQQLSERRLAQGLSREQLADRMHLGIEQLAALESGDRDKLPEPVFIKAMVRRLSNHLELDADALVASLGSLSDGAVSNERESQQKGPLSPPLQPPSRPKKGAIWLWLVLIGATALGALAWVQRAALLELIQQPQSNSARATATAKTTTTSNESISPASTTASDTPPDTAPDTAPEVALVLPSSSGVELANSGPVTIKSKEPSWIALRREGTIEFEGILEGERIITNPDEVEIYAGRPDLLTVSISNGEPKVLGTISDIQWIPLKPEHSR